MPQFEEYSLSEHGSNFNGSLQSLADLLLLLDKVVETSDYNDETMGTEEEEEGKEPEYQEEEAEKKEEEEETEEEQKECKANILLKHNTSGSRKRRCDDTNQSKYSLEELFEDAGIAAESLGLKNGWSVRKPVKRLKETHTVENSSSLSGRQGSSKVVDIDQLQKYIRDFEPQITQAAKYYYLTRRRKAWIPEDAPHICGPLCTFENMPVYIFIRDRNFEDKYDESLDPRIHVHTHFCWSKLPENVLTGIDPPAAMVLCPTHRPSSLLCYSDMIYVCLRSFKIHFCGLSCDSNYYTITDEGEVCNISGFCRQSDQCQNHNKVYYDGFSIIDKTKNTTFHPESRMSISADKFMRHLMEFLEQEERMQFKIKRGVLINNLNAVSFYGMRVEWLLDESVFDNIRPFLREFAAVRGSTAMITCLQYFKIMRLACWNVLFSARRTFLDYSDVIRGFCMGMQELEKYVKESCQARAPMFISEMHRIIRANRKFLDPIVLLRKDLTLYQRERLVDWYASLAIQIFAYVSMVQISATHEIMGLKEEFDSDGLSSYGFNESIEAEDEGEIDLSDIAECGYSRDEEDVMQCNPAEFMIAILCKCSGGGINTSASRASYLVQDVLEKMEEMGKHDYVDTILKRKGVSAGSGLDPRIYMDAGDITSILPNDPLVKVLLPNQATFNKYDLIRKKIGIYSQAILDMVSRLKMKNSVKSFRLMVLNIQAVLSKNPNSPSICDMLKKSYQDILDIHGKRIKRR